LIKNAQAVSDTIPMCRL